jgi:3',5'-cyclic AMP phosphodiesterase CpdA
MARPMFLDMPRFIDKSGSQERVGTCSSLGVEIQTITGHGMWIRTRHFSRRRPVVVAFVSTILAAAAVCCSVYRALAHEAEGDHEHVAKVPDDVVHRPTAIPDRILLSWVDDPSTTQAVTWRTDTTVKKGLAQIALADHGPLFVPGARELAADTQPLETNLGPAHYHTVNFQELEPKTKYVYRVGDGTNWSEWIHFTTASAEPATFTFVYFGDAQNDLKSHWSRVIREAYSDAPKAAFMLHAGDLINHANSDAEWGEWFYAGSFIHRMIPCLATPGNHEYEKHQAVAGGSISHQLSRHWRPMFAFPLNGPEGLEESVYFVDYQGARIISLNSNESHQRQIPWLETVLSENPHPWTVVTFHHPVYSTARGRDNPEIREAWQPVFDKFKVDIVLQGHDHSYGRSQLMASQNVPTGVTARSKEAGTVYVVSVSGPKMYNLGSQPMMRRVAEDTQLYQILTISGHKLLYEARTAVGELYDAFTLIKRPGQVNELLERVPDTPERRRAAGKSAGG